MQKLKIGVNMTVYIVDLDNNIIVPLSFDVANLAQFEREMDDEYGCFWFDNEDDALGCMDQFMQVIK